MIIYTNIEIFLASKIENAYYITDSTVASLYPQIFKDKNVTVIMAGETSKNMATVLDICTQMLQSHCDRSTTIIAIGGGVVGDISGFCASIFMRGIKWINVPTTLLAQVDSSIGGKTGVDLNGYKNILGAFNLPQSVVICNEFLATLPPREWTCGIGEVIKTAMLDSDIFNFLLSNSAALFNRDNAVTLKIVQRCSSFKEGVTTRDFLESGERKNLNIGHTVGHALEGANSYAASHGEYVLWGLKAESFIFKDQIQPEFYEAVNSLINSALGQAVLNFDAEKAAQISRGDKKNHDSKIAIITCVSAGKTIENMLSEDEFYIGLQNWRKSL